MTDQGLVAMSLLFLALVMLSAMAVVYVKYDARLMFNQLQKELREQDKLGVEWSRLQLEKNTWSSNSRIEKLARTKLNLQTPKPEQIVYIQVR